MDRMDREMKHQALQSLAALLQQHYVFPEVAAGLQAELERCWEAGEYDDAESPAELAAALTEHLRASTGDKHLSVLHAPEQPKADPQPEGKPGLDEAFAVTARSDNYGFHKIERLPGNIGLLDFHIFLPPELAGETAACAMTLLADTSGLIIDLRRNGGGSPHMVAFLTSYLLDPEPVHLNSLHWRGKEPQQFWSLPYVPGKRFGGTKPVYVLTSRRTFSAAEEFCYNLQSIGRAVVVGEQTGGGAHPGDMHRIHPLFEAFIPTGRAVNPTSGGNWEGTGIRPDVEVPEDEALETAYVALLEAEQKRLAAEPLVRGQERVRREIEQALQRRREETE